MPKLSIITVNLNNATGLCKTIESVVIQSFTDFEFIVIDGGSTDGSIDILTKNTDKISYWISEPDKGIYNAMNKGILKATGDYLQFLNSGDWLVDKDILLKIFNNPRSADIIYGHINLIYSDKTKIHRILNESILTLGYFIDCTLAHPASFISRKLFSNTLYDDSYGISADKLFFIDKIIFQNCSLQRVDEIIVNFNTYGTSHQTQNQSKMKDENDKIITSLVPPRILKDYEIYKLHYSDIQSLIEIKKYKLLYFFFKVLKKIVSFLDR